MWANVISTQVSARDAAPACPSTPNAMTNFAQTTVQCEVQGYFPIQIKIR